jgi:hypothetical protein
MESAYLPFTNKDYSTFGIIDLDLNGFLVLLVFGRKRRKLNLPAAIIRFSKGIQIRENPGTDSENVGFE